MCSRHQFAGCTCHDRLLFGDQGTQVVLLCKIRRSMVLMEVVSVPQNLAICTIPSGSKPKISAVPVPHIRRERLTTSILSISHHEWTANNTLSFKIGAKSQITTSLRVGIWRTWGHFRKKFYTLVEPTVVRMSSFCMLYN